MFEIPKITVRLVKEPKQCYSDTQIKGPEDVFNILEELYEVTTLAEEHFFCVFLNATNRVLGAQEVSVGALNSAPAHPRSQPPIGRGHFLDPGPGAHP